jgi:hypothetical protein
VTTPPGGDPDSHPVPGSGPFSAPEQASYPAQPYPSQQPYAQPPQPYPSQPYPSYQQQPYGGPLTPTPTRPPLDGVSVASVVTALLGLTPVGLVLGVIGIVRTAGGRRRGLGLAVAGILVSILVAAFQVFFVGAIWPDIRAGYEDALEDSRAASGVDDTGDVAEADEAQEPADEAGELVPFEELTVGDCFDEPTEEEFTDILVLPCDVPHDGEVVAEVTLEDGEWLGDDEVFELAYDACLSAAADAFEEAGVDGRDLDFWTFTPTREGWVLLGDREVDCLAYGLDGPLTAPVLPRP